MQLYRQKRNKPRKRLHNMLTQKENTISFMADLPEGLHERFTEYLSSKHKDHADAVKTAIAMFLVVQGDGKAAQYYLEGIYSND